VFAKLDARYGSEASQLRSFSINRVLYPREKISKPNVNLKGITARKALSVIIRKKEEVQQHIA